MSRNPLFCYRTTALQPAQEQTFLYGKETQEGSMLTVLAQSLASPLRQSVVLTCSEGTTTTKLISHRPVNIIH